MQLPNMVYVSSSARNMSAPCAAGPGLGFRVGTISTEINETPEEPQVWS